MFDKGKRVRGKSLLIAYTEREDGGLRVAFLTAKALGSAVRRNRQRRRVREACRSLWPAIAARPADLVFMALPSTAKTGFGALQQEMEAILRQAGILPGAGGRKRGTSR